MLTPNSCSELSSYLLILSDVSLTAKTINSYTQYRHLLPKIFKELQHKGKFSIRSLLQSVVNTSEGHLPLGTSL